jgi:hypothetical protein
MKKWVLLNLTFTGVNLAVSLGVAMALAYLYAWLRGDFLPRGGTAIDVPRSIVISMNFLTYLPGFMAIGAVLGTAVGQVQFLTWIRQQDKG